MDTSLIGTVALAAVGGAAYLLVGSAPIALPLIPDPVLTPGAVASTDPTVVCVPGYSKAHRVWHDKPETLKKYHLPLEASSLVEDDDRVPVALGGNNGSPLNHWPEEWSQARRKDHTELLTWEAVCIHHTMSLEDAQAFFLGDSWYNK
jgi:hypothetical protein